jgi:hypothetical protein
MPKSEAFAIATQQSHAGGHYPKGYGTAKGKRVAKTKFDTPKDDVQVANPGHLSSPHLKEAGMRIDYGLDFKPVHALTHDEWLAGLFQRDGAFHVPAALRHVGPLGKHGMAGFVDELQSINKEAGALGGLLEGAKKALTTPIEGTPELLPHGALEAIKRFGSTAPPPLAKKPPVDWRAARQAAFK